MIAQKMNSAIDSTCVDPRNYTTQKLSQYGFPLFSSCNDIFMIWFFATFIISNTFIRDEANSKYFNAAVMSDDSLQQQYIKNLIFISILIYTPLKLKFVMNFFSIFTSCTVDIPTQSAPRSFNNRASATVS